jgi:hypothetical protein
MEETMSRNKHTTTIFLIVLFTLFPLSGLTAQDWQLFWPSVMNFPVGEDARSVVVSDFDKDGIEDLAVANCHSDDVAILLGKGNGSFHEASFFGAGDGPESIAIGDFNNDGKEDLVVANTGNPYGPGDGSVFILLGFGDGSFHEAALCDSAFDPTSVAIGDFDNDGNEDLVVTWWNYGPYYGGIKIYLGAGDGTFQPPLIHETVDFPRSVAGNDFDNDGNEDLVVGYMGVDPLYIHSIGILLGNGDGTFDNIFSYPIACSPRSVVIGDFDNNGNEDLAVAVGDGGMYFVGAVLIFIGEGDGSFREETYLGGSMAIHQSVAIGDFNDDGNEDLVTGWAAGGFEQFGTSGTTTYMGEGNGSFYEASHLRLGSLSIAIGDFNGDGDEDIATTNWDWLVSIALGEGDGSFATAPGYEGDGNSIAIGDFDEDGNEDLVITYDDPSYANNDAIIIRMGEGGGYFGDSSSYEAGEGLHSVVIGDFDEDGHQDLAAANNEGVAVLLGMGNGSFGAASFYSAGEYTRSIAIGDFNEDGHQDLAAVNTNEGAPGINAVTILLGGGNGSFREALSCLVGDHPSSIITGDFNNDGHDDLAVACQGRYPSNDGCVTILVGTGNGSFAAASFYEAGEEPISIAVGDFDNDGNEDLAVVNDDHGENIAILSGAGDGSFAVPSFYEAGYIFSWGSSVAISDLDSDGNEDLAVTVGGATAVLIGTGDGSFGDASYYEGGGTIAVGDFDRDGQKDLAMTGITILMNNSTHVGIENDPEGELCLPKSIALSQNYPNPFNPSTTIMFELPGSAYKGTQGPRQNVSLIVYDIRGRRVRTLINTELEPGSYQVHWDGRNDTGQSVASGVYLYTLGVGNENHIRKMTMFK